MADITNDNMVVREIKSLAPKLTYCAPPYFEQQPSYLCFSHGSHGSTSDGQTGYLSRVYLLAGVRAILSTG